METRAHDTSDSARYNAEFKYIRTDDHRLLGDLLVEAFSLRLADVKVERRHQGRQREEEQQRGQRRGVQRGQLHDGGTEMGLLDCEGNYRALKGPREDRIMMWPFADFVQDVLSVVFSSTLNLTSKSRC